MKNPFLKYVTKDKKEDIFHSSTYGRMQNGSAMGSTSAESFAGRMKTDRNRRVVSGYNRSNLVGSSIGNGPRAKQYVPLEKNIPTVSPSVPKK